MGSGSELPISLTPAKTLNAVARDVVLGYDKLTSYVANNPYFGAIIGRYGNRLEALKGNLEGFYSIRVNDQWRITFRWDNDIHDVSLIDYH